MRSFSSVIFILMILNGFVKPDCVPTYTSGYVSMANPTSVDQFVFKGTRVSNVPGISVAQKSQFPYICEISVNKPADSSICTGSIIASKWILTSKTCVRLGTQILVTCGLCSSGCTPTKLFATRYYVAKDEAGYFANIALLLLENDLVYSDTIQPIKLPSPLELNFDFNGYNTTSINYFFNSGGYSTDLQYLGTDISQLQCVFSQSLCSLPCCGTDSLTVGDKGGAIAIYTEYSFKVAKLVGINIGSYVSDSITYQISTKVSGFLNWIMQVTQMVYKTNAMMPGTSLKVGDVLTSNTGCFTLSFDVNGNIVIRDNNNATVWQSNTANKGATEFNMQEDGNLVLYNKGVTPATVLWSSETYGNCNLYAVMQDDGNFVIYRKLTAVWSSKTARLNYPSKC